MDENNNRTKSEIDWQDVVNKCSSSKQHPTRVLEDNEFTASILTGCIRQAVKNKLRLQEYTIETLRFFQVGNIFHDYMQKDCSRGFIDRPVEFEKRIIFEHDGIRIYGHVDAFDGENVYDFKTTSDIKMSKRFAIHLGYVYQLSVYLHALKAKRAYVVYLAKKDLSVHQKEITPYNRGTISKFCYDVMEACKKYETTKLLPPRDKCFICMKEFSKKLRP